MEALILSLLLLTMAIIVIRRGICASNYTIEFYRDIKKQYRWRAIHKNGNIIADCAEGYHNQADCRSSFDAILDSDKNCSHHIEFYQDAKKEIRWRLRHRNSNIVADSGEGYKGQEDCHLAFINWKKALQNRSFRIKFAYGFN
jgi:uncharacterized protein YegP (UPF0339 family)